MARKNKKQLEETLSSACPVYMNFVCAETGHTKEKIHNAASINANKQINEEVAHYMA